MTVFEAVPESADIKPLTELDDVKSASGSKSAAQPISAPDLQLTVLADTLLQIISWPLFQLKATSQIISCLAACLLQFPASIASDSLESSRVLHSPTERSCLRRCTPTQFYLTALPPERFCLSFKHPSHPPEPVCPKFSALLFSNLSSLLLRLCHAPRPST